MQGRVASSCHPSLMLFINRRDLMQVVAGSFTPYVQSDPVGLALAPPPPSGGGGVP